MAAGLTPANGATGLSVTTTFRIEFCGMTGLEINYFNLLNPQGSVVGSPGSPAFDVTQGDYWAELEPHQNLTEGVTYSLEIDGRINDNGTIKQLAAGTWDVTIAVPDTEFLYSENFNNTSYSIPHQLSENQCQASQPTGFGWGYCNTAEAGNVHLVNDPAPGGSRGTVMRIDFYEGNYAIWSTVPGYTAHPSGMQGSIWSHSGIDELYLAYDIFYPNSFIYNFAMKNSRIGGGEFQASDNPANYGKYCECGTGFWGNNPSSRAAALQYGCGEIQTPVDGDIAVYSYHANRFQHTEKSGTPHQKGQWNRVELHVKINTPYTSSNGEYHFWLNGQLIQSVTDRQWRNGVDSTMQWDLITLVFYEGGNTGCWVCPQNQSLYLDNLIISENRITG